VINVKAVIKRLPFARQSVLALRRLDIAVRHCSITWGFRRSIKGCGKFIAMDRKVHLDVSCAHGSKIELVGNLITQSDLGEVGLCQIVLGSHATLSVLGDFFLGPNVSIHLAEYAKLELGGRKMTTASGITGSTRVMVKKALKIGTDTIIAWNVFITDCDWHQITGSACVVPTEIGRKVWIAHGASVLKGSHIGDGCIVAAHSVCTEKIYPARSLIAGVPGRIVRSNIDWCREIDIACS
jgi:carbonic anhydrase/acetyltransferase-like protein (isoleucine patch superfamily)